ncbi:hypothetical protein MPH_05595 [Macrophomina phaseolina MS6]|uniref:Nudix hydrolase domain-containing protein n=1 Tax=Macrophomina phaseolina (strain MS6) TaxID=1126212 RepID=K2R475_MACPH|nr:hypothetical protein MPH_05595 [Macrophomina phaseolina MS6]
MEDPPKMPSQTLPDFSFPVKVTYKRHDDEHKQKRFENTQLEFKAFKDWRRSIRNNLERQSEPGHNFQADPWILREVKVHSVHVFANDKIGFMTIEAFFERAVEEPKKLDRVVFLRGGSVAMLMILRPRDSPNEREVIMTDQPRIGACSMSFLEIPAGMLDESDEVKGKVIDEIKEETGFSIYKGELIDLTELALREVVVDDDLKSAMYPSPANLDEFIPLFLWEKELDRLEIEDLKGKLTGLRKQQEMITLRIVPFESLWKVGARDAKTLAAWALYTGLSKEGTIQKELQAIRTGPRTGSRKRRRSSSY